MQFLTTSLRVSRCAEFLIYVAFVLGTLCFAYPAHADPAVWNATHFSISGSSGIGVAYQDQRSLWPYSTPPQACWQDGYSASCYSWKDNLSCAGSPPYPDDGEPCGGSAGRSGCTGNLLTYLGMCVAQTSQAPGNTCKATADPVIINTGEVVETETDWTSGGSDPLVLSRRYGAMDEPVFAPSYSRIGAHWRTNFDGGAKYALSSGFPAPNSAINGDLIHIALPDGHEYSFRYSSTSGWQAVVPDIAPNTANYAFWDYYRTDLDMVLTTTATTVDLRDTDGKHYIFDINGLLTTIVFSDGYMQSLTYVSGINTSVTDSLGRKMVFKYDTSFDRPSYLTAVITPDGQEIDYSYTNRADLLLSGVQVAGYPVIVAGYWALNTVTYPDTTPTIPTDNPKRIYTYGTDATLPFELANITDERGIVNATWTYDTKGRALTNEKAGGQEHYGFSYDDANNKVTVTNPLGRQTVYTLQTKWGMVNNIVAVDGIATTNCAASNTAYTFDANGYRNQSTDAEGRVTQWTKNARGLPTTTIEGAGTASARTTTTTWDTTRPLPTQILAPGLTTNVTYNTAGQMTQLSQVDTTTTTTPYSTNGQTRTTLFNYTAFTAPSPPTITASGTALSDVNLTVINPGAETGTVSGWSNLNSSSPLAIQSGSPCVTAHCFITGGSTTPSSVKPMIAYQDIAIPAANTAEVDAGKRAAKVTWNQYQDTNVDEATVRMVFLNSSGVALSASEAAPSINLSWTARSKISPMPVGTRTIRVEMVVPTFPYWINRDYFDDIAVTLTADGTASAKPFLTVANPEGINNTTTGWTQTGIVTSPANYPCQWFTCLANSTGSTAANDQITQDIAITSDRYSEVDNKARAVELQWMDQSNSTFAKVYAQIDFLNASNAVIAGASMVSPATAYVPSLTQPPNIWGQRVMDADVPTGARKVRLTFSFYRQNLSANGGFRANISAISLQLIGRAQPIGSVNLLTSVDGPLAGTGDTVTYAYDTNGNLNQVTDEVGLITKVTAVDVNNRPTTVQRPDGVNTNRAYDPRGRLSTVTVNPGAGQAQTSITYDAAGNVIKVIQPDGSFLQYTYDNAARVSSVINNTGETVTYTYNANSQAITAVTKTSGGTITKQMSMVYDELGRLLKSIGAASQTTVYAYDRTDNLTKITDPRSNLYGYAYDSLNRLVQTKDQENGTTNLTLSAQDKVTAYQDPLSITTTYVRNGFGDAIQEVSPHAGTTTYVRDLRGLITQQTDGRSIVTNRTYDNSGRLLTESYPAATAENVTYAYDSVTGSAYGKSRLTSITDQSGSTTYTYNVLGQTVTDVRVIGGKTYTTSYLYDTAGHITQITSPSGRIVTYTRNANGQVTAVTTRQTSGSTAVNVATGIAYAPLSNLVTSLTHGNGLVTTATYDQDYRLSTLVVASGATAGLSLSYGYSDGLNLTSITDNLTSANSVSLWYTPTRRLQNAGGPWGSSTYYYDAGGNRTYDINTVGSATTTRIDGFAPPYARINGVTENGATVRTYGYDGAGNITSDARPGETYVFTYNNRNRVSSLTRNAVAYATYGYNALEQMVSRSTSAPGGPSGTVHYLYDLDGHLLAEANGSTGAITRDYIWMAANDNTPVDMPLAVAEGVSLYMVHNDHLGRPIGMTDATQAIVFLATYKPFGEVYSVTGTKTMNLRFPGQYFLIETGLAYNWHRSYDQMTGRYTQPDPLRFIDGPNVYSYVGSNPTIKTDRDGLFSLPYTIDPNGVTGPSPNLKHCDNDNDWNWCHNHCWERAIVYGKDIQPLYARCMNNCLGFTTPKSWK